LCHGILRLEWSAAGCRWRRHRLGALRPPNSWKLWAPKRSQQSEFNRRLTEN